MFIHLNYEWEKKNRRKNVPSNLIKLSSWVSFCNGVGLVYRHLIRKSYRREKRDDNSKQMYNLENKRKQFFFLGDRENVRIVQII